MRKVYLLILCMFCLLPGVQAQYRSGAGLGLPDVLRSPEVVQKLKENNYVSSRKVAPQRALPSIPDKTAYAFLLDNNEPVEHMGMIRFQIPKPDVYSILMDADMNYAVYTGVCVDDLYYAFIVKFSAVGYPFPQELVTIDLETGERKHVCSLTHLDQLSFSDLTYDYSTGTVYGIANTEGMFKTALYSFSLEDGTATKISVMDGTYILAIACSYDGKLYGLGTGGGLYQIEPSSGKITLIGNTGYMPWFIQSMEFDHTDNKLYWAGADVEHTFLAQIDLKDASTIEIGTFEPNSNVTGLYIPFTRVSKGAPNKVTNLQVVAGQKGELYADLKWTNPQTDPFGNVLSGTMGIRVYRDAELIADLVDKQPGETCTFTDTEVLSKGNYTYRLVTYNEVGTGEDEKAKVWLGEDYPAAPEQILLEASDDKVKISWKVPEIGKNGGWVNHTKLNSTVYRVQDGLEIGNTDTYTLTDSQLDKLGKWSYRVVVADQEGYSSESASDSIVAGPALEPPYSEDFQSDNSIDYWTILNLGNDTLVWKYMHPQPGTNEYFLKYQSGYYQPASDIAFAPPVRLLAGRDYKISFDMKIFRMALKTTEKLALLASKSPTVGCPTDTIATFTLSDYHTVWENKSFVFSPKNDGSYYLGLYLYSDANQNYVCMDNWKVEELFYYDLEAVGVTGPLSALTDIRSDYQVTVRNKGSKDVTSFTMQLVDETGASLTDEISVNETLASGQSKTYTLAWIPKNTRVDQKICLKVGMPTDGDESNNISPAFVVNVQSSGQYEVTMGQSIDQGKLPFLHDVEGAVRSQSIYQKAEINSTSGLIDRLVWYTRGIEVLPVNMDVKIYLQNTDQSDLKAGWMNVDDMTLVYDGSLSVANASQDTIVIDLQQLFLYTGSNLCIHIERARSKYYGWRGGFDIYRAPDKQIISRYNNGVYDSETDLKPVLTMRLNSSGNRLSGLVSDQDGKPLSGVEVSVPDCGMKYLTTDDGTYAFELVSQGRHEILFSKFGYYEQKDTVEISGNPDTPVEQNARLSQIPAYDFTIEVRNAGGEPVSDVEVILEGYEKRTLFTDASGKVEANDLFSSTYQITVQASDYQSEYTSVELKSDDSRTFVLNPLSYPVNYLSVNPASYQISWQEPVRWLEKRFDDGVVTWRCGYSPDSSIERSAFGIVIDEPGIVKTISWYLVGTDGQRDRTVNLYIFYMGEDGKPLKEPVYVKKGIQVSSLNDWFEYKLEEEFRAEKSYFVALSCTEEYLGLGIDSGTGEGDYLWRPSKQFCTYDYEYDFFPSDLWYNGNYMIRVATTELNPEPLKTVGLIENYQVYRFLDEQRSEPASWTRIASVKETSFEDKEMSGKPQGYYRYAVTASWKGTGESQAQISDLIIKDMLTEVTVKVSSNVGQAAALEGTEIRLDSEDGKYSYQGRLTDGMTDYTFHDVSKDVYKLTLLHPRFEPMVVTVQPNKDNQYVFGPYELSESLKEPVNLQAEPEDGTQKYRISWNRTTSIFDDFEQHKDFELNSAGPIGWMYLDNDDNESTYGLSADQQRVEYDNWGARTAYIIFNPSATNPRTDTSSALNPWSGDKFLGSFSSSFGPNDDFIISPELFFNDDFTFSFYAKAYTDMYGTDRMMVGYSQTDIEPESFIWINEGDYQAVGGAFWQNYTYTIPASARYVAIRCVSDNTFLFMVDDIQIGDESYEPYQTYATSYEVYLDGVKIGETTEDNYTVEIDERMHTVGVKAVYSTGTSEMVTMKLNDASSIASDPWKAEVYYADRGLWFEGTATQTVIYSTTGSAVATFGKSENHIDLSSLSSGMYMAVVTIDSRNQIVKFIIE